MWGGAFSTIGGLARSNLAHINSDGTLDTNWNPGTNEQVISLAISGTTIYAGGNFTYGGGASRNYLAAFNLTDGTATSWNPNVDNQVSSLTISGTTIYAGGYFTTVNRSTTSDTRRSLAAFNLTDGTVTSWNPNVFGGSNAVFSLAISGTTLYAGGWFSTVNTSTTRRNLAAFDLTTGIATSWNPNIIGGGGKVFSLAISGTTIYAGGMFTTVNTSTTRNYLAAFDLTTGTATSWDPNISSEVYSLVVSGSTIYVGGSFTTVNNSTTRNSFAAFDLTTGIATSWNPSFNNTVVSLTISGSTMYMGGTFDTVNGISIPYLTSFASNSAPNTPSSLSPTNKVDGSTSSNTQPTLTFTLTDPNGSDTNKYQIIISTHSDFSSPVVDYTSELNTQGSKSFTVGQAAGSGTYTVGSESQDLPDGSYYWEVRAIDAEPLTSSYALANSGAIAFIVNTYVAPVHTSGGGGGFIRLPIIIQPTVPTNIPTVTSQLTTKVNTNNLLTKHTNTKSDKIEIKNLQTILNTILKLNLKVDGIFGRQTLATIKKFQKDHKLKVDGELGPNTRSEMNKLIENLNSTSI